MPLLRQGVEFTYRHWRNKSKNNKKNRCGKNWTDKPGTPTPTNKTGKKPARCKWWSSTTRSKGTHSFPSSRAEWEAPTQGSLLGELLREQSSNCGSHCEQPSRMPGSPLTAFHHNRGAERKPLPFLLLLTVSPLLSFSSLQVLPLNIKFISTVTNHKAFIRTEAEVRSPIPRPHHTKRDDNLLIQPRATLG